MALAVSALVLSLAFPSNWDSVSWQPANPIVGTGAVVLHDDGTAIRAFSATTRRFQSIAPAGNPILGAGDYVAVVRDGATRYVGFSARRGASAAFVTADPLDAAIVGDDVAVLIFSSGAGKKIAYGYSAQTNVWDQFGYTPVSATLADDLAVSRFVALLRTTAGLRGFSARLGAWSGFAGTTSAETPIAEGNVAVARIASTNVAMAFSGVLGTWAASPVLDPGNVTRVGPNLAFVAAASGASWKACAYSAYDNRWVTSPFGRTPGASLVQVKDNVILISSATPPEPDYEVIGVRPHLGWAAVSFASGAYFAPAADYVIVQNLGSKQAYGFSGLTGGGFSPPQSYNHFSGSTMQAHQFVAIDDPNDLVYGFSPATNAFVTTAQPTAYTIANGDAVFELIGSTAGVKTQKAFSARWGLFTASDPLEPGATYATVAGGSVVASVQQTGVAANSIFVFDERADRHTPAYQPGFATTLSAKRNVLLAERAGGTKEWRAYSVQRADWSAPSGAATGAPLVAPVVEDDVLWLVDSAGRLHAFGAHGDLAAWFAWPNDTEYQTFGDATGLYPPSIVGMTFTGAAIETPYLLAALAPKVPGLTVGGFSNPLGLDVASLSVFGPFAVIGPGLAEPLVFGAGITAAGTHLQVFLQGAFTGGGPPNRLGVRCEGIWIF